MRRCTLASFPNQFELFHLYYDYALPFRKNLVVSLYIRFEKGKATAAHSTLAHTT